MSHISSHSLVHVLCFILSYFLYTCCFRFSIFASPIIVVLFWFKLHFVPSNIHFQSYNVCFTDSFDSFIFVIILNAFTFTSFVVIFGTHNLSKKSKNIANESSRVLQLPLYLSKLSKYGQLHSLSGFRLINVELYKYRSLFKVMHFALCEVNDLTKLNVAIDIIYLKRILF